MKRTIRKFWNFWNKHGSKIIIPAIPTFIFGSVGALIGLFMSSFITTFLISASIGLAIGLIWLFILHQMQGTG